MQTQDMMADIQNADKLVGEYFVSNQNRMV